MIAFEEDNKPWSYEPQKRKTDWLEFCLVQEPEN